MDDIRTSATGFLRDHGMFAGGIDFEHEVNVFIDEMRKGLERKGSSLRMIPTYITVAGSVPCDKPVLVLDAGGTNFRRAAVTFTAGGGVKIDGYTKNRMPGSQGTVTKEFFFETIADLIGETSGVSDAVGFCFSYPTEIRPDRDGRVVYMSKEVVVEGLVGEYIGSNLIKVLREKGNAALRRVVVLNDTVATLLGGISSRPGRIFGSYLGMILGTGTNICYSEKVSEIPAVRTTGYGEDSMIINIESGGYNRLPFGDIDDAFDRTTVAPGDYRLEKTLSGAYFGGIVLETFKTAAGARLFGRTGCERIAALEKLTPGEIDRFLEFPFEIANPLGGIFAGNENDLKKAFHLADGLLKRAALFAAVGLAAAVLKCRPPADPLRPVCIVMEGTTYYRARFLASYFQSYLHDFLTEKHGIYFETVSVENATLIGSAVAGLTN